MGKSPFVMNRKRCSTPIIVYQNQTQANGLASEIQPNSGISILRQALQNRLFEERKNTKRTEDLRRSQHADSRLTNNVNITKCAFSKKQPKSIRRESDRELKPDVLTKSSKLNVNTLKLFEALRAKKIISNPKPEFKKETYSARMSNRKPKLLIETDCFYRVEGNNIESSKQLEFNERKMSHKKNSFLLRNMK